MKKRILATLCLLVGLFVSISLTGCMFKDDYDVKLMVDGEIYETVLFEDLDTVEDPTREYFNFVGWSLYGENIIVDLLNIDKQCTLYAKWSVKDGYHCDKIISNSMDPVFKHGDYIIVDTNATDFQIGDIIKYAIVRGESVIYVAHRIIDINTENGQYIVKGDANTGTETIDKDQIIGKVCEILDSISDIIYF